MTAPAASLRYRFGRFELQPDERRLLADQQAVHLGPHAFDLLVALVDRAGHLATKDELLARVWGKVIVEENTLQAHASALRKVLGSEAIATVSGRGYRFTLVVTRETSPSAHVRPPAHNLPQPLTSFIGRDREIAEVRQWLATTRLLTLSGAGGCGKTRLALQVAATMLEPHPDGVWFVELAPLGDPSLVIQSIAKALGVIEESGKDLLETVAEWLAPRQLLLVLDNVEHLLGPCAQLADALLRRCAGLSLLVTSRERLGIEGELTYRVPSLSVPGALADATTGEVLACEAARLFVDRARLQRPGFEVTGNDAAALASICRRLDGIALAIELAAPRVRVMSLQELSRRLDDRFGMLTGGSRTALPRHRTLRSLIDWSHELLDEPEKALLRRASVFAGGWTLQAAGQVCSGASVGHAEVLDLLTSLTDKNLVLAETQGDDTRFSLLETVRHYAQDRLRESGEEEAMRDRHVDFFLDMASRLLDPAQTDSQLQAKLLQLDQEHDNVRAALAWCEASPARSVKGLGLAGQLHWFWRMRGHYGEGRGWIARLLAIAPDATREDAHASAFHAAGALAYLQGDYAAAEGRHREALAIWQREANRRGIVRSLISLGSIANSRGELSVACGLYEDALRIAREIGDRRSISMGLQCLGMAAHDAGDYGAAKALLQECVAISREIGAWRAALALSVLGEVRLAQGEFEAARCLLLEALEGQRALGDRPGTASTLLALAIVSHDEGDVAAAKSQLKEALDTMPTGDALSHAAWLDAFAGLSLAFASASCAARLWGCTQRLREEIGSPMTTPERARHERLMAAARSALQDDSAFDAAWNEGRAWALDEAVRYALKL
ncbi:tetratricopeptide repeat protein [Variovorax sp. J22R133]|uniref:ATP-binding protein n=1 Tax=Variovorax brevis TaxID=3053503 RepID=UPI002575FD43|nr:tetratricopeptide repeat protein [Variovorax sp. J22R133]MDM0115972.1 tetratricopeptide repeat protein [Variovorax sp. J22R133]